MQRVPSHCFANCDFEGNYLADIVSCLDCLRPFGEHLGRPKLAHGSHNDVRRLGWHAGAIFVLLAELGLRKPASGNLVGFGLLGEGLLHLPASACCGPAIAVNRGKQR